MSHMRSWLAAALVVAAVAATGACTEPRSKRCSDVCGREATCREKIETGDNFDEGECVDACAALERDSHTEPQVVEHLDCVRAADSCQQVIDCP